MGYGQRPVSLVECRERHPFSTSEYPSSPEYPFSTVMAAYPCGARSTLLGRLWRSLYTMRDPLWNPRMGARPSRRHGITPSRRHVRHAVTALIQSRRHAVMGKARLWLKTGYGEACTPCVIPCGIPGWGHGSYPVTPLWAQPGYGRIPWRSPEYPFRPVMAKPVHHA